MQVSDSFIFGALTSLAYITLHTAIILRAILRPNREPASRVAWVVVIIVLPVIGIISYILFGETCIGRKRVARMKQVVAEIETTVEAQIHTEPDLPEQYAHLFQVASSINHFKPVGGNSGELLQDSNATIDAMVADMDAAKEHIHLIFYIWLSDSNGLKIVDALKRAATRGVKCRAMADGLGSRAMTGSIHWKAMQAAGVQTSVALPLINILLLPLLIPFHGRVDLRNHRKIVIIDHQVTYCGSQNCADPEFRAKAKYAPWVDAMIRFEGPIAQQNQQLFASDWMAHVDEDLSSLLRSAPSATTAGFTAQVIGTGPTVRYSAMPELFETLIYAARHTLTITTPYYVPNESMQEALCACARRGVATTIIFPARNDSWVVGAASHSYYEDLLRAGVRIFEYTEGLLHTKSLTIDGDITLIGSANMDRRSFELNYENNILLHDRALTEQMQQRQAQYRTESNEVTLAMVEAWPITRRLWNNTIGMLGPIL